MHATMPERFLQNDLDSVYRGALATWRPLLFDGLKGGDSPVSVEAPA